jgi:hypothetical protein
VAPLWRSVALTWAAHIACLPIGRAAPPGPAVPAVVRAEPAPEWNARFATTAGWIGGDGAYSAVLGPDRVLWLFGDSLFGTVSDGRRDGAVLVNNALGVQAKGGKDTAIRFVVGKARDRKPAAAFAPVDGKGWLWPQAAIRVADRLFVFLPQVEKSDDPGVFGFRHVAQWLAVVENPDDEPEKWRVRQRRMPFADFGPDRERSWGSAVLEDDGFVYVYGYDEAKGNGIGNRRLTVARVPAAKLDDFGAWRFRTADGWSAKAADATAWADGLATELSVSRAPGGKQYVAVYTENGLGDRIVGRFADAPDGPWSAPLLLYTCPEMGADKGVFSYAAKAHPWAGAADELVVSYCVNTWQFSRLFRDDQVYRPKFVRVTMRQDK